MSEVRAPIIHMKMAKWFFRKEADKILLADEKGKDMGTILDVTEHNSPGHMMIKLVVGPVWSVPLRGFQQDENAFCEPFASCKDSRSAFLQAWKRYAGRTVAENRSSNGGTSSPKESEGDNDVIKRHLVGEYMIPVAKMVAPSWKRLCRHPDLGHVDTLAARFKSCPDRPYTILAVHVHGLAPEMFNRRNLHQYSYEVIGGNHTRLALQKLHSEDPDEAKYTTHMARVYCDLPDSLAKKIGMEHNNIHFSLPSTVADNLFSFRAAAYAEAGYTDEAHLTTVEPPCTKEKESQWKDGLCTMLGIVGTETTSKRKKLTNLYGVEIRLAMSPCKVWNKLTEFVKKWQEGGIKKQPKQGRQLKACHLRFLDKRNDDNKIAVLQQLIDGELEYGFDKKKTQEKDQPGKAGVKAPVYGGPSVAKLHIYKDY
ncbi:uncharacterized protein LOC144924011 [Branchiostoma floridae x Branchiostoma belcheri]